MGTPNSEGIQAGNALPPTSQPLSSIQTSQPRKVRGSCRGDIQTPAEGSGQCSEGRAGPIFQPDILSPQIRWVLAACDQYPGAEHTLSPPPFQDGGSPNGEGCDTIERLASEAGPEGCVPLSPGGPGVQTLAKISVAESDLPVRYSPLWLKQRSIRLHQTAETSSRHSQTGRDQIGPVPGRHDHHGQVGTRRPDTPCHGNGDSNSPRLYSEPKEECSRAFSVSRVPRIPPGFTHDDDLSPKLQDPDDTVSGEGNQEPESSHSIETLSVAGDNGINPPSHPPGPSILQTGGESQNSWVETQPILRDDGDSVRGDEEGPVVVAQRSPEAQWQVNADHVVGQND